MRGRWVVWACLLVAVLCGRRAEARQGEPATGGAVGGAATPVMPAARMARNVAIITIHGEIDRVMATSIRRRIAQAEAGGADALVLEIDTPGGEVGSMMEICAAIEAATKPTVAWVNRDAYSAGTFIALACREIVAVPGATMGDAAPIAMGPGGLQSMGATERAKLVAPLLALLVNSARRNGYSEEFVQGFVQLGVELWLVERSDTGERRFVGVAEYRYLFGADPPVGRPALAGGVGGTRSPRRAAPASGAAQGSTDFKPAGRMAPTVVSDVNKNLTQRRTQRDFTPADVGKWNLVEKVSDGSGLFTLKNDDLLAYGFSSGTVANEEELKRFFAAQNVQRLDLEWYEVLARWLDKPVVKGVLIVLFLLGLFVEMTHPGIVLPGLIAMLALGLLLAPDILLGAGGWWQVIAVVLGILLIALEIFVLPGLGIFGIIGLVLLFGGLLGTFIPPGGTFDTGERGSSSLLYGVATLVISTAVALIAMYFIGKHFGRLPFLSKLVLKDAREVGGATASVFAALGPDSGAAGAGSAVRAGDEGVAITPLRPAGRVTINDEVVDVVTESGFIAAGQGVRVVKVSRFEITVEPISSGVRMGQGPGAGKVGGEVAGGTREGGDA